MITPYLYVAIQYFYYCKHFIAVLSITYSTKQTSTPI